ncbi:class I SAM-dependent methyltransferase [Cohnella hongkongensis]|uniref:Class I SAM-dependent methyltransferase n=1 Tax=Cohnella hongkongensis TaxID=178337 RepID=A0ABV9FLI7_9BACL
MYHGVRLKADYKQLWVEGMKDWNGGLSERMTDDEKEEAFWQTFLQEKKGEPDAYSAGIREELLRYIAPGDDVLEIGPGWGNYTFSVAEKAAAMTCVDSSRSVLDFLQKEAAGKGLRPMEMIHAKWEQYTPGRQYDVVFGVNCFYRMEDIEQTLLHMNEAARKYAVIGWTSGPERPHLLDFHQELGVKVKFQRRDYIHLTNLLYELGIDTNCKILELERNYLYASKEELLRSCLKDIIDPSYDRKAAEDIVLRHVTIEDGVYSYKHRFKTALLHWKPDAGYKPAIRQ